METINKSILKTDTRGNTIFTEGNAIFLQISDNGSKERIGRFDMENKRIIINKEHYDYNERFKSYSFNEAVLRIAKKCDTVRLICPEGRFDIPIAEILKYGTPLIYETFGLTKQLYIELSWIKKYPIN